MANSKTVRKRTKTRPCLIRGCQNARERRGLCNACFQAAYRMLRAGKVTEEQLLAAGLLLPARRGKRPAAFVKAAEKALTRCGRHNRP